MYQKWDRRLTSRTLRWGLGRFFAKCTLRSHRHFARGPHTGEIPPIVTRSIYEQQQTTVLVSAESATKLCIIILHALIENYTNLYTKINIVQFLPLHQIPRVQYRVKIVQ